MIGNCNDGFGFTTRRALRSSQGLSQREKENLIPLRSKARCARMAEMIGVIFEFRRLHLEREMIDTIQMRKHGNSLLSTFPY